MKRILSMALCLFTLVQASASDATPATVARASSYDYDFIVNGIRYRINEDNASVVVVRSSDYKLLTDVVIPDTVEYSGTKFRVTQIRPFAFYDCKQLKSVVINAEKTLHESFAGVTTLTKVVMGKGARILDENVFRSCSNLTDLEIQPGLQEIRNYALNGCASLQHLKIPSTVVTILGTPFLNCTGLVTITVDENNPKYDSRYNCNALIETASNRLLVSSMSTVIPDDIEIIGPYAFYRSPLESVNLPSNLNAIENYAFYQSNLSEISFPVSLTIIYPYAFSHSRLTDVILPNGLQTICEYAFYGCSNLRSITFPRTLTNIMDGALTECINLKCVVFEDGGNALSTGRRVFLNSGKHQCLQWISLPNFTKTIGAHALLLGNPINDTPKLLLLKTFRVPDSVDSLGSVKLAENVYISELSKLRSISNIYDNTIDITTGHLEVKTFTFGLNLSSFGRSSVNLWSSDIITLLPSVSSIEDAWLSAQSHIYCYSDTPPVCNENTFATTSSYNTIVVHVPEGAVDAYKSAPRWSFFVNVVGDAVMPTSLRFTKTAIHVKPGEYVTPHVILLPENANGGTLAFACADANVAAVTDDNRVQALEKGRTTLHCTYGALHATCEIIVDDEDYIEPCDINGDGTVDISDVNAVINMMLGKSPALADITGDGQVDISDVNAAINAMLGKE